MREMGQAGWMRASVPLEANLEAAVARRHFEDAVDAAKDAESALEAAAAHPDMSVDFIRAMLGVPKLDSPTGRCEESIDNRRTTRTAERRRQRVHLSDSEDDTLPTEVPKGAMSQPVGELSKTTQTSLEWGQGLSST